MVGLFLEIFVETFPLLFEGCDEFLALFFRHQHLLFVSLVLLLNLHLPHEVVLVLNLCLDFGNVFRHFSVCLFLKEVLFFLSWQFWSCKNVLNCVRHDEILV